MPLQRQTLSLPFATGIDEKTDPRQVRGNLLNLQNGRFVKGGAIAKRYGTQRLDTDIYTGSNVGQFDRLFSYREELLAQAANRLFAYDNTNAEWTNLDQLVPLSVESQDFPVNSSSLGAGEADSFVRYDVGIAGGYAVYVWEDDSMEAFYAVRDLDTGTLVQPPTLLIDNNTVGGVFAAAVGTRVLIVYGDEAGSNIKMRVFDSATPETLAAAVNLKTDLENAPPSTLDSLLFGVTSNATAAYCAYLNNAATITTFKFDHTGVLDTAANVSEVPVNHISVALDGQANPYVYVFYNITGPDFRVFARQSTAGMASAFVPQSIDTGGAVFKSGGVQNASTSVKVFFHYYDISNPQNTRTRKADVTNAGVVSGVADVVRGITMLSYPKKVGNKFYWMGYYATVTGAGSTLPTQSSPFLFDEDGNMVARYLTGFGPYVWQSLAEGSFMTTLEQVVGNRYLAIMPVFFGIQRGGVKGVFFDFDTYPAAMQTALISGSLLIGTGGFLGAYDGHQFVEHGFVQFPDPLSATDASTGGFLSNGTYSIAFVYEWTDGSGVVHESAPGILVHELSGGTSTQKITVTVPTLRVTNKESVRIISYMTEANGTAHYQFTSLPTANNPAVDSVSIALTATPNTSNPQLYTDGGELDNIAPDAPGAMEARGDRVFIDQGSGRFWFSKRYTEGSPLEFSDTLFLDIPNKFGNISAITSMDYRVIILTQKGIHYLDGVGPDNLGNGVFPPIRDVLSPVGAVPGSPTAKTGSGVFFVSTRGIELLGRDVAVAQPFIGAHVEDLVNAAGVSSISAAVVVPDQSEVRFVLSGDGRTLVYNYFFGQWAEWESPSIKHAVMWGDASPVYVEGGLSDIIRKEVTTSHHYLDSAGAFLQTYNLQLDTEWIKAQHLQEYKRIYKIVVLGEWKTNHTLTMSLYLDYKETAVETKSTGFVTADPAPYQYELQPGRQKNQAFRIRLLEAPNTGTTGESVILTHLALEVGMKTGIFRKGAAQTL